MAEQPHPATPGRRKKVTGFWLTIATLALALAAGASIRANALGPMPSARAVQAAAPAQQVVVLAPTPVMIPLQFPDDFLPTAFSFYVEPTPYPPLPADLQGKILFLSDVNMETTGYLWYNDDRCDDLVDDLSEDSYVYVIDPLTQGLWLLTDAWPYMAAAERESSSANLNYRALVKDENRHEIECYWDYDWDADEFYEVCEPSYPIPQYRIKYYDRQFDVTNDLTRFGAGDAWDPAWSPVRDEVVFVSNDSGNDEIYVVTKDQWPARQLTHNTGAWDKHPSWSPDGRSIVFYSSRGGQQQLWLMDADGTNQRPLTDPLYRACSPIWVKYLD